MNRIIFQVILVLLSVGLFFTIVNPMYTNESADAPGVKKLQSEIAKYNEALDKSDQLAAEKDRLLAIKTNLSPEDRTKIEKMLPDSIDNIRLVIDINNIAQRYDLILKQLQFTGNGSAKNTKNTTASLDQNGRDITIGGDETTGSVEFSFSVTAQYETFKRFLSDLEDSLRIIDVSAIKMTQVSDTDFYDFNITLKTYWLH